MLRKIISGAMFVAGMLLVCVNQDTTPLAQLWLSVIGGGALMAAGFFVAVGGADERARRERRKLAKRRKTA